MRKRIYIYVYNWTIDYATTAPVRIIGTDNRLNN